MLLARALYPDPQVLILDEGTANLDAENENKILETLKTLKITRIAVAHRPATLKAAQRVVGVIGGKAKTVEKATEERQPAAQPTMAFGLQSQTSNWSTQATNSDRMVIGGPTSNRG